MPYTFHAGKLPRARQIMYQLCDIYDDDIKKIITENDGKVWNLPGTTLVIRYLFLPYPLFATLFWLFLLSSEGGLHSDESIFFLCIEDITIALDPNVLCNYYEEIQAQYHGERNTMATP